MVNLKVPKRRETQNMGRTECKYTCALGGFTPQSVAPLQDGDELLSGRQVHCQFMITDELIGFLNNDVLPRINAVAKYVWARKLDDHTLFLVHNEAAEESPHEALTPFINAYKGFVGLVMHDDEDMFLRLKYGGNVAPPRTALPPQTEDSLESVAAVSSKTGPFCYIEHN
jgi:hypothetical protein